MNWEETLDKAKELGFTFEERTWIPDDYEEDEYGRKHPVTKPDTQLKVTFPGDYPHPPDWINIGDINALQRNLNEYLNKDKVAEETRQHNIKVEEGIKKLKNMFNK